MPQDFLDLAVSGQAGITAPAGGDVARFSTDGVSLLVSSGGVPAPVGQLNQAQLSLARMYALTGLNSANSLNFVHTFDAGDTGWTTESRTAGGAVAATAPVAVAEWDGNPFIQSNGTDSLSRGFVRNIAGTFTNHNPRTILLDQVTPWAVTCKFQMIADSGGYILFGASDPTSTGIVPKGVFCGFEHGTNSQFFEGYKTNAGGGSNVDIASSTIQLDGNWHIGTVYCPADGSGAYKFLVDNEAPVTLPNAFPFANLLASVRICFAVAGNGRASWLSAIWPVRT